MAEFPEPGTLIDLEVAVKARLERAGGVSVDLPRPERPFKVPPESYDGTINKCQMTNAKC